MYRGLPWVHCRLVEHNGAPSSAHRNFKGHKNVTKKAGKQCPPHISNRPLTAVEYTLGSQLAGWSRASECSSTKPCSPSSPSGLLCLCRRIGTQGPCTRLHGCWWQARCPTGTSHRRCVVVAFPRLRCFSTYSTATCCHCPLSLSCGCFMVLWSP